MSRSRDISIILGATEVANTGNIALSSGAGGVDSASVISLIDSSYITLRAPAAGIDSASVISLVDSSYVSIREANAGAGGGVDSSSYLGAIKVLDGLNKVWWHIDANNNPTIDDSFNLSSATDDTGYTYVTFSHTMNNNKWTCVLTSEQSEAIMSIFGSFETTTQCYFRSRYPHSSTNAEPSDVSGILTGDLA